MSENLEKIKQKYEAENELKKLKKEFEDIEHDFAVQKFNPDSRSISLLYDILDSIQEMQSRIGRLKIKVLKEETRCDLCYYDCKNIYDEEYDKEINAIKGNNEFKNVSEKQSYTKNVLRDKNIENYIIYFEKKKMKIKNFIKEIDVLLKVVDEMDDKSSRKISLMQLQKELGVLVDIKFKKD
jgi:hypothetical protein